MSCAPLGLFITSVLELKLDDNTSFEWQKFSQDLPDFTHYDKLLSFLNLWAQASLPMGGRLLLVVMIMQEGEASHLLLMLPMHLMHLPTVFCARQKSILYRPVHDSRIFLTSKRTLPSNLTIFASIACVQGTT